MISDFIHRSAAGDIFCPFAAYMPQTYHLIVCYSCHCEWGERKALPVIVRRVWSDAEMDTILQLFLLSPLLSHENKPNLCHLAYNPAYSWTSSCRHGTANAQMFFFTPVLDRQTAPVTDKSTDMTLYAAIIPRRLTPFSDLVSFYYNKLRES